MDGQKDGCLRGWANVKAFVGITHCNQKVFGVMFQNTSYLKIQIFQKFQLKENKIELTGTILILN